MKKYYLKQFRKSEHFKERQKERNVSDYEIEKILNFGAPFYTDGLFNYKWGSKVVTVCLATYTLITVHPGDYPETVSKFLDNKKDANILSFKRKDSGIKEFQEKEQNNKNKAA